MKNELQVIGPPGTGKTTFLAKQVKASCEEFGSENIMVTSLTRTAAKELVGRNLPIPDNNVSTLHSFCYRALKSPVIAETQLEGWNLLYPQYELTILKQDKDDLNLSPKKTLADVLLNAIQLKRSQMINSVSKAEREFLSLWNDWKFENAYIDFVDMIERGLNEVEINDKKVIIADEVQDYSKLEMALVRKWGESSNVKKFIIAGDSDQLLYEWRGADPDLFRHSWVTSQNRKILKQSYRVSQNVHKAALTWINNIYDREQIEYYPTEKVGEVIRSDITIKSIKTNNRFINKVKEYIEKGKEVMILASCGYMLPPILKALKQNGIMFHNPYRTKRGDWNPLNRQGTAAQDRILSWVISDPQTYRTKEEWRMWTIKDVQIFSEHLKADGVFKKRKKNAFLNISEEEATREITDKIWFEYFQETALHDLWSFEPKRFMNLLMDSKKTSYEYPFEIVKNYGFKKLNERPLVKVGTIHSVKGGEADSVFLFPDLSSEAFNNYKTRRGKNAIIRTFYVGMTRAKEDLILCSPSEFGHVEWGNISNIAPLKRY